MDIYYSLPSKRLFTTRSDAITAPMFAFLQCTLLTKRKAFAQYASTHFLTMKDRNT